MDVIRMRDGKQFVLKRIPKIPNNERAMALYLSTPPPSEDPRNNCIPVEDVLNPPGDAHSEIIVMRLLRPFDSPRFDTIGECVDFFLQAFKVALFYVFNNLPLPVRLTGSSIHARSACRT